MKSVAPGSHAAADAAASASAASASAASASAAASPAASAAASPLPPRHLALASLGTGVFAFAIYLATLAPSMTFIDAGELAAVAHTFGIAHPTGYPLFTLLAGLWAQLPFGDGIVRLNLLAAVLTATAAALLVPLFWHLLAHATRRRPRSAPAQKTKKTSATPKKVEPAAALRLAAAVAGALTAAFSQTFWRTGTAIEVYALHLAMLALVLLLFVRAEFDSLDDRMRMRRRLLFALALGLSFTNHMTTILLLPGLAVAYFMVNGTRAAAWRGIARMVPAALAGLLPYIYLPLRAASGPALAWGNPATWERFLWHISGKQYRTWMFTGGDAARRQLTAFIEGFPAEFAYVLVLAVAVGAVYAFARHPRAAWFLTTLFLTTVFYSINYDIHDIDSYFLLAYVAAAGWAAFGFLWLVRALGHWGRTVQLGALAVPIGLAIGMTWSSASERGNHLVEDYTRNMFNSLKPNALVLSFQWDYWVSASYYYQLVEGWRNDVVVIDKELLRRSWYLDQIRRNHPDIYQRSQREIEAFRVQLDRFEHDLPYDGAAIEARFNEMIESFFANNAERPLYVTLEIEQHIAKDYVRVPEGLALRLYRADALPSRDARAPDAFEWRPFLRPGRLEDGIRGMYASMLINRGIWLHTAGRFAEAAPYFERAFEFDAGNANARMWRQRNEEAMTQTRG